LHEAEQVQCG